MGWTVENRAGKQAADCSPYLNLNNVRRVTFAELTHLLIFACLFIRLIQNGKSICLTSLLPPLTLHLHRYEAIGGDVAVLKEQQNNLNAR